MSNRLHCIFNLVQATFWRKYSGPRVISSRHVFLTLEVRRETLKSSTQGAFHASGGNHRRRPGSAANMAPARAQSYGGGAEKAEVPGRRGPERGCGRVAALAGSQPKEGAPQGPRRAGRPRPRTEWRHSQLSYPAFALFFLSLCTAESGTWDSTSVDSAQFLPAPALFSDWSPVQPTPTVGRTFTLGSSAFSLVRKGSPS